jgi:hypothetical protein
MDHPAAFRGKRACRFVEERAKGVEWNHEASTL